MRVLKVENRKKRVYEEIARNPNAEFKTMSLGEMIERAKLGASADLCDEGKRLSQYLYGDVYDISEYGGGRNVLEYKFGKTLGKVFDKQRINNPNSLLDYAETTDFKKYYSEWYGWKEKSKFEYIGYRVDINEFYQRDNNVKYSWWDDLMGDCNVFTDKLLLNIDKFGIDEDLLKDRFHDMYIIEYLLSKVKITKTNSDNGRFREVTRDWILQYLYHFYFDEQFVKLLNRYIMEGFEYELQPVLDHLHPVGKGGCDSVSNLQFITIVENRAKLDVPYKQWLEIKKNMHKYFV